MKRVEYIAIAKALRDSPMNKACREFAVRAVLGAIKEYTPLVDEKSFRAVANIEDYRDPKVMFRIEAREGAKDGEV